MDAETRSLSNLFQHPESDEDAMEHFTDVSSRGNRDLVALYRLVWREHHPPIRRAKVIRSTGNARLQEIQTPDYCWVVETKAFSVLKAPRTIMIRKENVACFANLIRRYSGDLTPFIMPTDDDDGNNDHEEDTGRLTESGPALSSSPTPHHFTASSKSEKLSAIAPDTSDSSGDSMIVDKAEEPIPLSSPTPFANPFEDAALKQGNRKDSAGVIVSGQRGIGGSFVPSISRMGIHLAIRKKRPITPHPHLASPCPPSHDMARL